MNSPGAGRLQKWGAWASLLSVPLAVVLSIRWDEVYPIGHLAAFALIAVAAFVWALTLQAQLKHAGPAPDSVQPDRELFAEFLDLLPPGTGFIGFLRAHPWDLSFDRTELQPMYAYLDRWNDAMHVFHDQRLRTQERKLYGQVADLLELVAQHVFQRPGVGDLRVHPAAGSLDLENAENRYALEAVRALNTAAHELVRGHDEFILLARQRLGL